MAQLWRFGVVGAIGFGVDAAVLIGLIEAGLSPFLARVISFGVAVAATWWLNRNWTFAASSVAPVGAQLRAYVAVQLLGAAVNYAAYSAFLGYSGASSLNAFYGLAIGSGLGMVVNFAGAKFFVFDRANVQRGTTR